MTIIDPKTGIAVIPDLTPPHKNRKQGVHGASTAQSLLNSGDVDDTPVNGETTVPISSNWAYDHDIATTGTHGAGTSTIEITARKGAASGYASLNASTLVVENPANATATATASKIPIADTAGSLNSWVSLPILAVASAQFDKTADTALANVTGLALTLAGTTSYILEAVLFVDADVTGGHKYALDGTVTASSIKYQVNSISNASNLNVINTRLTALAGTTGQAGATGVYTEIMGTILTNAAGTINIRFAQQVASGTSSILSQSSFMAMKVV